MDKREALEIFLKVNKECIGKNCDDCKFYQPYCGKNKCLFDFLGTEGISNGVEEILCSLEKSEEDRAIKMPESSKPDNVNHPKHYCKGGLECIDAIRAAVSDLQGIEAVYAGKVIKYVWRFKGKNGLEDLKKAKRCLEWLIEEVKNNG